MSTHLHPSEAERNDAILARVEELGGGSVWDAEVFAVTLMDDAVMDSDAMPLTGLVGVQQIALDCSRLSTSTLRSIVGISWLKSLVLCNPVFAAGDLLALQAVGPEVQVVTE